MVPEKNTTVTINHTRFHLRNTRASNNQLQPHSPRYLGGNMRVLSCCHTTNEQQIVAWNIVKREVVRVEIVRDNRVVPTSVTVPQIVFPIQEMSPCVRLERTKVREHTLVPNERFATQQRDRISHDLLRQPSDRQQQIPWCSTLRNFFDRTLVHRQPSRMGRFPTDMPPHTVLIMLPKPTHSFLVADQRNMLSANSLVVFARIKNHIIASVGHHPAELQQLHRVGASHELLGC